MSNDILTSIKKLKSPELFKPIEKKILSNYLKEICNKESIEITDDAIDLLSNGYKIRTTGTGTNANGGTYVYMVWAENPFKYANAR